MWRHGKRWGENILGGENVGEGGERTGRRYGWDGSQREWEGPRVLGWAFWRDMEVLDSVSAQRLLQNQVYQSGATSLTWGKEKTSLFLRCHQGAKNTTGAIWVLWGPLTPGSLGLDC